MIIQDKKPTHFKSTTTETLEKNVSRLVTSVLYFHFAISFVHGRVSVAQWKSIRARNPKVWGSIPYGIFFFIPRSWQDEKHPSLFLYRAQNLPSHLFYLQAKFRGRYGTTLQNLCLHFVINRFVLAFQNKRWRKGAVTTFKKKKLLLFDYVHFPL